MPAQQNGDHSKPSIEDADFAKAFQELARGEQTATALENHLSALEAKIEELLNAAQRDEDSKNENRDHEHPESNADTKSAGHN